MFLTLKDEPEEIKSALESENGNAVTEIPISEIDDFPDHPFHVVVDDAMNEMADSIKKHGVLTPAVVRKKDDGRYELISGHRRKLFDVIEAEECTPSLSQAQRMKQAAQEGKLNRDGMELVMREEKPQQNNITIKGKKLERYFPRDFTPAQKEERIIKALDLYCRRLERMKQENEFER